MKGDSEIIQQLNQLLAFELAAMDQYFIHSRMYQDWGYDKLYTRIDHEFDDEKSHASALIERILFLEGVPDMTTREGLKIGTTVPEMLASDLRVEYAVDEKLKAVMALCEQKQDFVSRDILQTLINDTEVDHAFWLEQQLGLIDKIGLANYLQSQL
ncbi:bacterioferritin [Thalassotalea sp. G2M2-11]|uniref:bacterioferritin n=1 Tax=Thalassotalea sp. G2M2-11 TaxID=2787627 RepID=UPI0019D0BCD0|nr:bacterioferritin [Thalassotalea sp. G2M2-11]